MAEFNYPNGDLLVSASWLAQHLHDPNMKIVDARSAQDYAAGHIPGAVLLPNGAFRSTHGVPDACTPEEFAVTAGALGHAPGGCSRGSDTGMCASSIAASASGPQASIPRPPRRYSHTRPPTS